MDVRNPWSTGRVLTEKQREKKRQADRITKQKRKSESAERFAQLEQHIEALSAEIKTLQSPSSHVSPSEGYDFDCYDISWTPEETVTTIDSSSPFSKISSGAAFESPEFCQYDVQLSSDPIEIPHEVPQDVTEVALVGTEKNYNLESLPLPISTDGGSLFAVEDTANDIVNAFDQRHSLLPENSCLTWLDPLPSNDQTISNPQFPTLLQENEVQNLFSKLLQQARSAKASEICSSEDLNQDALIRGISHGWASMTGPPAQCPLWRIIRELDDRVFCRSGTVTRFCTLRMIHYMLLCLSQAISIKQLPPRYRPRPSQMLFPHVLAVDVLPWPALRERATLIPTLTTPNTFWHSVIYLFRFAFPYDVSSATMLCTKTGQYHFTGLWEDCVRDIRRWRMDEQFFTEWPEVWEDIAPVEEVRNVVNLGATTDAGFLRSFEEEEEDNGLVDVDWL